MAKNNCLLRTRIIEVIDDRATGKAARSKRQKKGIGLREMARRLNTRPRTLMNLEGGSHRWTHRWAYRYQRALAK